jgi:LysM repeat protein
VVQQYKVKTGDALWKIAKKFNVRTINIIAVNQKMNNPDKIFPGQTISIPNK